MKLLMLFAVLMMALVPIAFAMTDGYGSPMQDQLQWDYQDQMVNQDQQMQQQQQEQAMQSQKQNNASQMTMNNQSNWDNWEDQQGNYQRGNQGQNWQPQLGNQNQWQQPQMGYQDQFSGQIQNTFNPTFNPTNSFSVNPILNAYTSSPLYGNYGNSLYGNMYASSSFGAYPNLGGFGGGYGGFAYPFEQRVPTTVVVCSNIPRIAARLSGSVSGYGYGGFSPYGYGGFNLAPVFFTVAATSPSFSGTLYCQARPQII